MVRIAIVVLISAHLSTSFAIEADVSVRDEIIVTKFHEATMANIAKFKKDASELTGRLVVRDVFLLWLLYKSEYKLTGIPGDFEDARFEQLKRNAKNAGISLDEDDPLKWKSRITVNVKIGDVINGAGMLPPRFSNGGKAEYTVAIVAFAEWWKK